VGQNSNGNRRPTSAKSGMVRVGRKELPRRLRARKLVQSIRWMACIISTATCTKQSSMKPFFPYLFHIFVGKVSGSSAFPVYPTFSHLSFLPPVRCICLSTGEISGRLLLANTPKIRPLISPVESCSASCKTGVYMGPSSIGKVGHILRLIYKECQKTM